MENKTFRLDEANKLLQEDKVKTKFLSTVSHELKTHLSLVLGFAKIMGKNLDDVIFPHVKFDDNKVQKATIKVKDNIKIIVSECERLEDLINDLFDILKMEAGEVEWKMEPVSLTEVIERSLTKTSNFFEEKKLKLIRDVTEGLPGIVGDKDRLIQVMINLISNAVKFTKEGSIICRVRKTDSEIVTSIIDTGIGISAVDQERIFDKFNQVCDSLANKPKVTTLGLSICKHIIEHHSGRIWVESKVNGGSEFSFSLPFNT